MIAGEVILTAIGIHLAAFEIAGGIVLFLFAISMIFGDSKREEELKLMTSVKETAVFPLAIPSIASPGAMLAAVMQTVNSVYAISEQLQGTAMRLWCCLSLWCLCSGRAFDRFIGSSGACVISRVMGLILASVAVDSILSGLSSYFSI